ncbi:MAG: hypothetical protein Q8787_02850 [Sweet potato little leaf phytoplasma]|nr:hypothetical protein [Sweet potato little leaf phytoplasma]
MREEREKDDEERAKGERGRENENEIEGERGSKPREKENEIEGGKMKCFPLTLFS